MVEKLYELTKGDAYVTSDVGQHQMWAAQFYKFDKPRRWINSGGLGTMGFGLPHAMGVQLAHPEATVACVTGEASIQMCIQELSTCKQYHLPVKIVNLNNRYMGMVRQWQEFFHGNRYAESYMDALPDFVKLAESFGHVGMRIDKPADVEPALREAFSAQERPRVHGLHHRPDRERVPDGAGRQGPVGNDPGLDRTCDTSSPCCWRTRRARCRASPGLFSARGYNIESLTVAPTEDPSLSRMTIVTTGSDDVIEQITKQLNKLIDVVKVVDLSDGDHIERELMLVKVRAVGQGPRGDEAHGGYFPRPHHRRDRQGLHHRADRHRSQARCVSEAHRQQRDPGNRAHRRLGHRPRRPRSESLVRVGKEREGQAIFTFRPDPRLTLTKQR